MSYSAHAKKNKIKLALSPFFRSGKWHSWRGYVAGYPRKYFAQPDTKEGYNTALAEFCLWRSALNDQRPWVAELKHHLTLFQQVENWYAINGISNAELDAAKVVGEFIKWIQSQLESDSPALLLDFDMSKPFMLEFINGMIDEESYQQRPIKGSEKRFGSIGYELNGKWSERLRSIVPEGNKTPQTMEFWHAQYVEAQKEKFELNKTSFYTFKDARTKSAFFAERYPTLSVKKLSDETWRGYFNFLKTLKGKTGLDAKGKSKESYLKAARTFLKWCKRQATCEIVLPLNLDDPDLSFNGTDEETPVGERLKELWTLDEIKAVLNSDEKHFKAYVLLCLNCGFLEEDLHAIQHAQLTDNRLIHKRVKSKKKKRVPVVNYYLWKSTVDALNEIKTDPKQFSEMLHTARGVRIKSANNNNLSRNWQKVRTRLGLRPELNMRKLCNTATGILKESDNFRDMSRLYLGHAVTVEDRYYNIIDGQVLKPFDDALKYMGKKLGIKI
ncbi:hypothetical protein [Lacunimicrobium album]